MANFGGVVHVSLRQVLPPPNTCTLIVALFIPCQIRCTCQSRAGPHSHLCKTRRQRPHTVFRAACALSHCCHIPKTFSLAHIFFLCRRTWDSRARCRGGPASRSHTTDALAAGGPSRSRRTTSHSNTAVAVALAAKLPSCQTAPRLTQCYTDKSVQNWV